MNAAKLNVVEILKHLNKSNCGECGLPTCMAFAALVLQGQTDLAQCPYLDQKILDDFSSRLEVKKVRDDAPSQAMQDFKDRLKKLDLAEAAQRLGLQLVGDRLRVHVLGRIFDVDQTGEIHSLGHVNDWIQGPLLNYILSGQGQEPVGRWLPYSQLPGTKDWTRFFAHRCQKAMENLAFRLPELFIDILDTFGQRVDQGISDADVSIRLMIFPKLPVLFSYWEAEGQFEEKLALHFDQTATANLDAGSIFFLITGLTEMFTRFMQKHGA